jgi:uncharacterized protein (TIGR02996 family)
MIVGIVILLVVVAGAICLVGRNHLMRVAPTVTFDLARARHQIRAPQRQTILIAPPPAPAPQRRIAVPSPWVNPWSTRSWTVELASDRDEQRMLSDLRTSPGDLLLRMVYADWLEDHGELSRAAFVRGTEVLADQHAVVATTTLAWRAVTSHELVACKGLRCARRWDALEPIDDDELARNCPICGKTARYLDDVGKTGSCQANGDIPVLDVACTFTTAARPATPSAPDVG